MHHPLYWTQRYIMYKVTTKEKKKISIALNSLQLNLPFMRSDPQSNQRYETDPINYINTWMRAFVCLKLFSLWDMKNEEVTHRKTQKNIDKPLFFSSLPLFLTVRSRNSVTKITPFYPVLCSSDFSDKCHSRTFFQQYQRELTYWRESNPGLPPGKWEFYHWTTGALLRQSLP